MAAIPALAFVGRSGSGKTTLLERVVRALQARGYRVGVVKHTHHRAVETDLPGTDTRRFWDAGADAVVFLAPDRVALTQRYLEEPPLEAVLAAIPAVDVILVEGGKRSTLPKIEVVRAACDPALLPGLTQRIACVTDVPELPWAGPRFDFEPLEPLVDFIERVLNDGKLARD